MAQPAVAAGYRPHAASNPLKDIVEDNLEELFGVWDARFLSTYGPLHPRLRELFERFARCGDPHFGFLRLVCPDCKENRFVPYSCKVRGLCPSCGQKRAVAWAARTVEEMLPEVPYVQLVFTMPRILRKGFLFRRELYGDLARVAYAATSSSPASSFSPCSCHTSSCDVKRRFATSAQTSPRALVKEGVRRATVERKARAPPRQSELFSDDSRSQIPDIEEEDVNQDAPTLD